MSGSPRFTSALAGILAFALCGGPEILAAQQTTQSQDAQAAPAQTQNNVGTTPSSATPDPTRGPQQPQKSNLPNAPSATSNGQTTNTNNNAQQQQTQEAPLGAAAAQSAPAAGGAASKPAGTAIAPAKQRQVRSLLIKVGAIAAAGVAVGTIYALSRSAPSTPPGTTTSTTSVTAHGGH